MTQTRFTELITAGLLAAFLLAGCSLPVVTPPPEYSPTIAPTITAPIPATAIPATSTPNPIPSVITAANAPRLVPVNKVPVSNVQLVTWSADSSLLSLATANMDANGNNVYSAVSLDGKTLATKSIWPVPDGWISDISPDGRLVAVISADMTSMSIYDLGNENRDIVAISPGYFINNVTFSPDQKYFTVSSKDTWSVTLNSLPSGSEEKKLTGFETAAPIYTAGFKGNSNKIIWQARATLQLQDITSGTMGASVNSEDFFAAYQLSPDGRILAGAAAKTINGVSSPAVMLWDAASGNEIRTIALSQYVSSLSFSADSSLLAVGTGSEVLVYEVSGGTLLATLSGHSALVSLVAFSPDSLSLISAGQDNQLILWQVIQ